MKGCNEIKRLIDEADQPDIFPFEAHSHINACGDCKEFARERTAIRGLVSASGRVNAPANFDAVLQARLAEAKARKAFSWFSPAGMMRLGAAAAGVVVALLVVQFSGLLSKPEPAQTPQIKNPEIASAAPAREPGRAPSTRPPVDDRGRNNFVEPQAQPGHAASPSRVIRGTTSRSEAVASRSRAPESRRGIEDGGVVLVREQSGDREVALPAVSVGAQPLLYVSASRSAPRSAGTSF